MTVNPEALSHLSRDDLIERARQIGVEQPEPLTRAELQDEIVRRSEQDDRRRRVLRGWFGVARDLVASLVDQGLHLPEAANVIRGSEPPSGDTRSPVSTVTLAEIFASQGHRKKALRILAEVLEVEPEHAVARALHDRLTRDEAAPAAPSDGALDTASREAEPGSVEAPVPDVAPLPESPRTPAVAEEGAPPSPPAATENRPSDPVPREEGEGLAPSRSVATDPSDVAYCRVRRGEAVVYWELSPAGVERARARWPSARPVVQLVSVLPTRDGPARRLRELDIDENAGKATIGGVEGGAVVRAAVGWQTGSSFVPVAVAAELGADGGMTWVPWGHSASDAALERAAKQLCE